LTVLTFVVCTLLFASPMLGVHPFNQPDYQYNALESAAYLSLGHVIIALSVVLAAIVSKSGYGGKLSTE
jgi:hypothetical protein